MTGKAAPGHERGGVQSIERAFSILSQIAQHHGITLADLSKTVGLHTSTTFHLVRTMVKLGIVRQAGDSKRYHLGRVIFSLAASSSSEVEIIAVATPFLEAVARETGETTHLGIRSGPDALVVAKAVGSGAFQLVERTGGARPYHSTAIGKVLLAGLSDGELQRYFETAQLAASTPRTIVDRQGLRDEVMRVRQAVVAYDDGEFDQEMRCLAAPIHDLRGVVAGAIGISGPVWRIGIQRLEELARRLKTTAASISAELGHRSGEAR